MADSLKRDPWADLRGLTPSRIALGRSGDGLPTPSLLDLQMAHACARDAVHGEVDFEALALSLAPLRSLQVHSAATDRATYLRRPDLGRKLREAVPGKPKGYDVVFVIADGLSAAAVTKHAVATLNACMSRLEGLRIAPIVLASQARVALADEIGEQIRAKVSVILIGERPGLSVADSLGIYVTYDPRVGRKDSERNCISNIHERGLTYEQAADHLAWLVKEALRRQLTGVALKARASLEG